MVRQQLASDVDPSDSNQDGFAFPKWDNVGERISRVYHDSAINPFLSASHFLSIESWDFIVHGHLRGGHAGIRVKAILLKNNLVVGGGNVGEIKNRFGDQQGRSGRIALAIRKKIHTVSFSALTMPDNLSSLVLSYPL